MRCDLDELRTLFLFEKLSTEQLDWLCREGRVELIEPGWVYREGAPASCFYVLLEGSVVLSRQIGEDDVEVSRTDQRGVYAGALQAYLGDRVRQSYSNSLRVTAPSRFFVLDAQKFTELMTDWFPMALHLLEGLFFGAQTTQQAIGQRERLARTGFAVGGLDPRAQQPGHGGRRCDVGAARPGRRNAAQVGLDRGRAL